MYRLAKTTWKLLDLVIIFVMIFGSPTSALAQVWTDQPDYPPGATVTIHGDNSDADVEHNFAPGELVQVAVEGPNGYTATCENAADEAGAWACHVLLWDSPDAVGTYTYTATGTESGNVETGTFTDAAGSINKVYQHWSDEPAPGDWNNDILNANKSNYFEGEVVPHVFVYKASNNAPLTNGQSYSFNVTYNYYQQNTNAGGFAYMTTYNISRQPGPLNATNPYIPPTIDGTFSNGGGMHSGGAFYTVDADITNVSNVTYLGTGSLDGYVTITFTYTGTTTTNGIAEIYYGLDIAKPGEVPNQGSGITKGASAWTGGSLQTTVDIGGSGASSIQLNPAAIIVGQISGLKFNDLNGNGTKDTGEPVLSGWTINLCADSACSTILQTAITNATGSYSFSVTPGTYYIREVNQTDWSQTAPASVYYGALVVNGTTPQYLNQNFGNKQFIAAPSLSLLKQIGTSNAGPWSPSITVVGGSSVYYQFTVTNTGNVALSPVSVTDPTVDASGCTFTDPLPVGGFTSCVVGPVTAATLAGTYTNTATAHGGYGGTTYDSDKSSADYTVSAADKLTLTKTDDLNPAQYDHVGQVVTYTLTAKNEGNATLHNVTVSDNPALDNFTCTPASGSDVAPGDSIVCTGEHTITQADLDAGSFLDTGTADSDETQPVEAPDTIYGKTNLVLSLTKTDNLNPAKYDHAGQVVTYTLTATNDGNVTLHNVTVSDDPALDGFSCTPTVPAASLAPGGKIVCTGTHTITLADLNAGSFVDKGTADSNETQPVDATDTIYGQQSPALTLVKTATPITYSAMGDVINYSYAVKNTGNVTLAGPVTVSDDKATVTCPAGGLVPGAEMTCTVSYTITQADLDSGSVTNAAQAHANGTDSNFDDETVTAVKSPALLLTKSADPSTYDTVGQTITYSYVIKNTGNVTLSGPFSITDNKATVTCTQPADGALSPNEQMTCTATYTVTQADLDAGSVTNKATATNGTVTSNEATATVDAVAHPNLSLVKTATPATYSKVNDVISYSYEVKNIGNVALSPPYAVTDNKATVTCPQTPDPLPAGSSITCSASYAITQVDLDAGSVTNIATATATFGGNPVTSNEAQATVNAVQSPALAIDKTAQETTYAKAGDLIHYSYLVTNTGNVTLHDAITVTDTKTTATCPALPAGGLAPGDSITCAATYTITQANVDAGSLTNVAYATSGTTVSPTDTVTVPATQSPALTIVKTATPSTYSAVGDVISYSYLVTNSGNVTLFNITVTDDKATVTCPDTSAGLAPLGKITCNASYTISQADLDAGSVTNSAYAKSGDTQSPPDSVTVPATQTPALSLVKTASPSTYDAVGQTIAYSYVLKNTGNVTLNGPFTVSDNKATVTCPADLTLAVGASITCNATYSIMQADLDNGSVTNTAKGKGSFNGNDVFSNEDSQTVKAVQSPALSLVKTATPNFSNPVKIGDTISYKLVATNDGNVTLNNVTISDALLGTLTCTPAQPATLAPAATLTCTGSYALTQADIDAGHVANTAFATSKLPGGGEGPGGQDSQDVPVPQSPHITLVKTATPHFSDPVKIGDTISYELVATNDGNVTLTNVTISDALLGSLTCTPAQPATLAPGEKLTCTGSYSLTQADIDAGKVDNIGIAKSDQTPPTETPNDVPVPQAPHLTLAKVGVLDMTVIAPADRADVGDKINYTLTATNDGNQTLTNVTITDPLLGTLTCTPAQPATLAPSEQLVCKGSYTLTQADINAGNVHNVAVEKSDQTPPADTPNDVPVPEAPALTIDKTATPSTYGKVGDIISYSYLVTNSGNVTLFNITVTDNKAAVTCPDTSAGVAPQGTITCSASYTITQADLDAGSLTNSAYAKSGDTQSPPDEVTVPATQKPALTIVKTATPTSYDHVGQTIAYSYKVENTGNVTISGPFTVFDDKASDESCPATPTSLAPGDTITCTASYAVTQADLDSGSVTNAAYATGSFNGNEVKSNTDTETVTADQNPAISLTKSASPTTYDAVGQKITYSYGITNTGNVTLAGPFTVSDDKATVTCDAAPALGLAPLATLTCTATYTIKQADLDAGSITNTATASTTYGGKDVKSNEATATVIATQNPAISLTKSATPTTYSKVGDVISYSYVVKNTGNVTLPGPFSISDDTLGTISCPAGSLAPGASVTCTASYTIKQADLDAGSVTNTATASTSYGGKTVTSNEATATVTATQNPAISLTKSASPTLYDAVGDVITYTLVAKNTGNVTLHDVSISDPKLGTLTCTPSQPAILAPNATLTCTGTYTIQAADMGVLSITNTATVNGKGPQEKPVSATASATVYRQTGALLPTQTTCQQYASGAWPAMYDAFTYQVKSGKINSVSPGVIFYYNTITAPSASFTLTVVETLSLNWKPMFVQDVGQAILYNANCNKASGVTVTTTNNPYTVKFTVTGATPGATYYIGIKYTPQNLVGQPVKAPYPTSLYSWSTTGFTGSDASIPVKYKK